MDYIKHLNHYPDFPKKGIDFVDVLPLLLKKDVFRSIASDLDKAITCPNVAMIEARGFLFAPATMMTSDHVEHMICIRKPGKIPYAEGDLRSVEITKEYGTDTLFYRMSDMQACSPEGDTIYISIFDDILATGGTAEGLALALESEPVVIDSKSYKVKVKEFVFLVELASEIPGVSERLSKIAPVHSLIII